MKIRVKFRKLGYMKFVGHLDVLRYFQKAVRRANLPAKISGGFSPHMIMSFAQPLGVGMTSEGDYFDMELLEPVTSKEAVRRLNEVMVEGMEVVSVRQIPEEKKASGMTVVAAADYVCSLPKHTEEGAAVCIAKAAKAFLDQSEILVVKQTKKSEQEVNIRPWIYHFSYENGTLSMQLATGSKENLKPQLAVEAFLRYAKTEENGDMKWDPSSVQYHRTELYGTNEQGELVSLEALGWEIV